MMIILPPQRGHGGRQSNGAAASAPVPLHSAWGLGAARSSRTCAMLAARPDGSDMSLLGFVAHPADAHVLDHPLAQRGGPLLRRGNLLSDN